MFREEKDGKIIEKRIFIGKKNPWVLLDYRIFDESDHLLDSELLVYNAYGALVIDERLQNDVWQFEWKEAKFGEVGRRFPKLDSIIFDFRNNK